MGASLEQVNSEAFEAFRLSHKSMGAIQIMTGRIPDYMREAVKILLGDNERAVERHLPIHLEEIKDIAEECTKLAENVEGKYKIVVDLLSELNQASLYKQGKLEENEKKFNTTLEESTSIKEA